jgi:hypothetical protein
LIGKAVAEGLSMVTKPVASRSLASVLASTLFVLGINSAKAAPPIRTSDQNHVPACVTPERLMAFLAERNPSIDPRFREIAHWYKYYGEGWHVRWDYAFFQMALETNYLSYRRGDGRRGDVWETQNNFAGIGATGGGVRGERFPDIKTGVHAQIQHLVAYSGEHLAAPIAKRTSENQDDIIARSNRLGRLVTFGDLARRWATDRAYGKSIDIVANLFQARYCDQPAQAAESDATPPAPLQIRREWRYPFRPPSGLGGPKPMDLAGPVSDDSAKGAEVLPWLAKPKTSAPAAAHDHPIAVAPKKHSLKTPKQASKPSKAPKTAQKSKKPRPASTAARVAPPAWSATTAPEQDAQETPVAPIVTSTLPPATADEAPGTTESTSYLPWLPTFRITPEVPQPSRLGGPLPADLGAAAKAAEAAPAPACKVLTASYGGSKTLLIRSRSGQEMQYTVLTIVDGFERSMFEAYARTEAIGAEIVGEYPSAEAALVDAKFNCPDENR